MLSDVKAKEPMLNDSADSSHRSSSPSKGLRWWPAAIILVLAGAALVNVWVKDASQLQDRVVPTMMVAILTGLLLLIWLFLLSRLPWKTRGRFFLGLVAFGVLGLGLFEVRGFTGDLIPDVRFRWGADALQTQSKLEADEVERSLYDAPQFLGANRNAVVENVRLETDWQTQPPKELWRQAVGDAWSSFVVVGSALLTQEQRGDQEAVVRYDLESGELVWVFHYPGTFESMIGGNGPRATPTVEGDRVYSLGSSGTLSSIDLRTGSLHWQKDLAAEHGATLPEWGYAGSPLVIDDLVVVAPGGPDGHSVVAYDAVSGDLRWRAGDDPAAYASPALLDILGVPQVVVRNLGSVTGHDPEDGRILWTLPWEGLQPNVAQPLPYGNDRLLISSGYGIGSQMVQFSLDAEGRFDHEILWESRRMKAKFTNMVSFEGAVYGLDDGVLVSLDPETGERHWKRGRYGHGQLLLVDDLLLILTEKGDVVLVPADPNEHRELARFNALGDKSWNPPTVSGRHLLLRNAREAVAYEIPVKG